MKNLKYLVLLLVALLIIPFSVFADEGEGEENLLVDTDSRVHVYLFRGEGCPHCQEAEEWFDSIQDEYGELFEVIDYETWYDSENAELMQKVADARKEEAEGVPYIIVGAKSWNGFTDSYKDEIISEIKAEHDTPVEDRYDVIQLVETGSTTPVEEKSSSDVLAVLLILIIVGGTCFGIYKARSSVN